MKLYNYTQNAVQETPDPLTDEYACANLIPDTPSAKALYCALRAEALESGERFHKDGILEAIRLVALAALPGEVRNG